MPNITIYVHRSSGGEPESFEAPANFSAEVFLEDVIRHFKLPSHNWKLVDKSTNREIDPTKTLEGNGIQSDHHLELSEKRAAPAAAPSSPERHEPITPPRTQETMRCPNCGEDNITKNKFCSRCGGLLRELPAEERVQKQPADVRLYVHTPDGRTAPVNIGLDLTLEELIQELREAGTVSKSANWRIYDDAGRELQPTFNLKQNGLGSGKHVYLREHITPPPPFKREDTPVHIPVQSRLEPERPSDRKWLGIIIAVLVIVVVCWAFYAMLRPSSTHGKHQPPPKSTFPPIHNPHPVKPQVH